MKNIPNIITSVRLICALIIAAMTATPDHGAGLFLPLFVAAAVSDMLDGFVARRFNWCTLFGARLDSISDLALYMSVSLFLAFAAPAALAQSAPLLALGAGTQIFHLGFSYLRFKQFPAYHTVFSRVCAYFIFFSVVAFWTMHTSFSFSLVGWLWLATCIEGIAITAILKQPMSNLDSIMFALRGLNMRGKPITN